MGLDWLVARPRTPPVSVSSVLKLLTSNVHAGDLNSETHTCNVNVLLSELHPARQRVSSMLQDSITTNPVREDKGMTPGRLPILQGRPHSQDALGNTTWKGIKKKTSQTWVGRDGTVERMVK